MDDDTSKQILEAITSLDAKVDRQFGELRKADEHIVEEVQRIKKDVDGVKGEVRELKSETLRTFESERHASQQTTQAITKHVDEAAQAFHAKADKIDKLETATNEQTEMLKAILGSPTAKKVGAAIAALAIAVCGWGAMRLQASVQKLEEKPAQVQPAPTVYLPVYVPAVDGGAK